MSQELEPKDQIAPEGVTNESDPEFEAQTSTETPVDEEIVVDETQESQQSFDGAAEPSLEVIEDEETEVDEYVDQASSQEEQLDKENSEDFETTEPAEASEIQAPAPAKSKLPKKPSLWQRIRNWFKRRRKPSVADSEESVESAPVYSEEGIKAALKQIEELRLSISTKSVSAESIEVQISTVESESRKLEEWIESMRRSYFSKVEKQMADYRSRAKSDIAQYEKLVESMSLPEQGRLAELRKKFHKTLSVTFISFFIPVAILFFIPWFSRANLFTWLSEVLSSPFYLLIVVTIAAVVLGILILLRRTLGKQKVPVKRSFGVMFWTLAIPLLAYGLFNLKNFLLQFVTPIMEDLRPTALWVLAILFIFTLLAGLIIYYQDWSVFRRQVTEELSGLDNVVAGYVKTKQELARLDFLYEQTTVWLKLLAHTIYRPWKVHPDWKAANPAQKSSESFPMALRVAQAVEDDLAESAQLKRAIANRLLVQGWRTDAFEKSLSQIGQHLGYDDSKVTAELLDSDLPHQPNNARKLVAEFFEHSAQTAQQGVLDLGKAGAEPQVVQSKVPPSDAYLVEVGRGYMKYLIEKTQGLALSEARPSVQHVVVDPLSELFNSDEDADHLEISQWHDFLSSGLGIDDRVQPPIGLLAFTDEGMKARSADAATSKILVPQRAANAVPKPGASTVELISLPDDTEQHPAEIIVRFDVTGPLPFRHVKLIQNSTNVSVQVSNEEYNDDI